MTRFVILAAPRTGSNLLCTLLGSHPDILCHHELFNPRGVFCARDWLDDHPFGDIDTRDRDPTGFLDRVWSHPVGERCVGLKWTRGQSTVALRTLTSEPGVKKIVLRRRHRLKTYVSERIARELDQWEVYDRKELVRDRPRLVVEGHDALEHASTNTRFYRSLEEALRGQAFCDIDYEDLLMPRLHRNILQFLDVDPDVPLRPGSVKQNPDDLRQIVANFDELRSQLRGTELESELSM